MKSIEEILKLDLADDMIDELSRRTAPIPSIVKLEKEYFPQGHKIYDTSLRPDKAIKGQNGNIERFEPVARIALPLQRIIVQRAVAFLLGNEVKISCTRNDVRAAAAWEAIRRTLWDNKSGSLNRRLARILMSETEVAELWYPVPEKGFWDKIAADDRYSYVNSVNPSHKLRVCIFSPSQGDTLYPLYDGYGDMIAFSRKWKTTDDDIEHYETYTDKYILRFSRSKSSHWILEEKIENHIGKIPVVYACQRQSEWADVQGLIERLEKLLSNFADTNDYHSSPKIFVTGEIRGFARKGETGAIIEGEANSTAQYLSWQQAPESVRLEINTLLGMIYSSTQTPDISFDSVKGLSNTSGVALKMMFLDAHLKVQNKCELWSEYLERRLNIIRAYMKVLNTAIAPYIDALDIRQEIQPYMIDDRTANIQALNIASGGKALISQRSAVRLSGLSSDPDEEYDTLLSEKQIDDIQEGHLNFSM